MADTLVLVMALITVIITVICGLLGHLIHLNGEKFGKFNNLHMILGTATTGLVVILVILVL